MSQYVGVGDDLKKEQLKNAKLKAQLDATQAQRGSTSAGGDSDVGGTPDMLVIGAVVAAVVGIVIWKKRKKG